MLRALLDVLAERLGYAPQSRLDRAEQRASSYREDYLAALESLERAVWRASNADLLKQDIKFLKEEIRRRECQEEFDFAKERVARAREWLDIAKKNRDNLAP